ncbi:MAG: MFS transporter [Planctomycetota bacterium]|nr:MFS transporter [Planctomycetota bacterium]
MNLAARVPARSRAFFRAALWDAAGGGVVGGVFGTFVGVAAYRLGASPFLLTVLSIAPFIGLLASVPMSRLAYRFAWAHLAGLTRIAGRVVLLAFAPVTGAGAFVWLASGISALQAAGAGFFDSLMQSHVRTPVRAPLLRWMRILPVALSLPAAWAAGVFLDADHAAYRWLFPAVGLLSAFTCAGLLFLPRRPLETQTDGRRVGLLAEVRILNRDRAFLVFMLVYFVGTLGEKLTGPSTPMYLVDQLHLSNSQIAMATGIAGPAAGIAGYLLWARLLSRVHPLFVLTFCMTAKALRPILWALAAYSPHPLAILAAAEISFALLIAGLDLAGLVCVLRMVRGDQGPLYLGIHYGFMGVRGLIGPVIGLWLYNAGVPMADIFWITAGIVLVGGLALWVFVRRYLARPAPPAGE